MSEVHPKVERIVRECLGRIQGKFMYSEREAIEAIKAVISQPAKKRRSGYVSTAESRVQPWKPGDPKPGTV